MVFYLCHAYQKSVTHLYIFNAEDLDTVIPMYNLLEYSDNYSMTSGSVLNYYRDQVNDDANESNPAGNCGVNNSKITTTKSFKYKGKKKGSAPADGNVKVTEVAVPLKYLNNFWRSLDLPLINCENPPTDCVQLMPVGVVPFQITSAKLYVPVVTFSINNNIHFFKFLENLKQGFKRTVSWLFGVEMTISKRLISS